MTATTVWHSFKKMFRNCILQRQSSQVIVDYGHQLFVPITDFVESLLSVLLQLLDFAETLFDFLVQVGAPYINMNVLIKIFERERLARAPLDEAREVKIVSGADRGMYNRVINTDGAHQVRLCPTLYSGRGFVA
jgi:hypothetical protein